MAQIGYHASHEQFKPSDLLRWVTLAEQAGFSCAMCSDHFFPWSERQGQSGFAWAWLGAALNATSLPFGVVNAPGQRYHPAIIAQAAATLGEMFPNRFWVALGSGQALNEHITGDKWPVKADRNARLKEAADVIRALWAGETVTHRGHFTVEDAKLYTRPDKPPLLVGAAITAETAEWVGSWADAVITIVKPRDDQQKFIEAFRRGGGEGKPIYLQAQHSYAPTQDEAVQGAWEQWRSNLFPSHVLGDIRLPAQFDALANYVTKDDVSKRLRVSSSPQQHADWIMEYVELGFERIFIHNANREQEQFITVFGEKVLPALEGAW